VDNTIEHNGSQYATDMTGGRFWLLGADSGSLGEVYDPRLLKRFRRCLRKKVKSTADLRPKYPPKGLVNKIRAIQERIQRADAERDKRREADKQAERYRKIVPASHAGDVGRIGAAAEKRERKNGGRKF
jgi:hypothetical protein